LYCKEEDEITISEQAKRNPELKEMIQESLEQYKQGQGMSTSELIESMSPEDFK
jgi:uncharacterized protein (DUF342 family)